MGFFAQGLQLMIDGQQRYIRSGLQCFLRVENFTPMGDFQEYGIPYAPTGTMAAQTGFVDILIDPPPEVTNKAMRDIGLSGGKLMFGAKEFHISHTFVLDMMQKYPAILDVYNVWRQWDGGVNQSPDAQTASVVGLIYEDRLYSIGDIERKAVGGNTIFWVLTCNLIEQELAIGSQESRQPL